MKQVYVYKGEWCGPCKMFAPTVQKLANELTEIQFNTIDVDSGDPKILEHGIRNVPTTVVVENGNVVRKQSGNMSVEQLKTLIG